LSSCVGGDIALSADSQVKALRAMWAILIFQHHKLAWQIRCVDATILANLRHMHVSRVRALCMPDEAA
jgi:hypothetical protein